jgi:hypothetical protein
VKYLTLLACGRPSNPLIPLCTIVIPSGASTHARTHNHFIHTWTPVYYLHHKFHAAINWKHAVYIPQAPPSMLHFGLRSENFEKLIEISLFLWGYTALTVSVFVLSLRSSSEKISITLLLLIYSRHRMSENFRYIFRKRWRELNDTSWDDRCGVVGNSETKWAGLYVP